MNAQLAAKLDDARRKALYLQGYGFKIKKLCVSTNIVMAVAADEQWFPVPNGTMTFLGFPFAMIGAPDTIAFEIE